MFKMLLLNTTGIIRQVVKRFLLLIIYMLWKDSSVIRL